MAPLKNSCCRSGGHSKYECNAVARFEPQPTQRLTSAVIPEHPAPNLAGLAHGPKANIKFTRLVTMVKTRDCHGRFSDPLQSENSVRASLIAFLQDTRSFDGEVENAARNPAARTRCPSGSLGVFN